MARSEHQVQVPLNEKQTNYVLGKKAELGMSEAEVMRAALDTLMKLEQHRQGLKDGIIPRDAPQWPLN